LRVPGGRRSAVGVAALAAILILSLAGPAVLAAKAPPGLARFMYAVGKVESGGRYTARNPHSGAYGKYQIMPSNWPAWAKTYLGNAKAKQTPANQEKVAAGKFTSLYRSLGSWRRVAYWWLTGSKRTTGWSSAAKHYVARVMRLYAKGGGTAGPDASPGTRRHYGERNAAIDYTGTWKNATYAGYAGDHVRYATSAGASATLTFTGRKVTWYSPAGPTRGKAKVYVDGAYVRTVNLHRGSFKARVATFRTSWSASGTHTLRIVVVGSAGHPMVAIDEFVVIQQASADGTTDDHVPPTTLLPAQPGRINAPR
jgi:Transglycosylase SLT domain